MLRFCSLGSGSSGNAAVVEAAAGTQRVRVLVDAGFGPRELGRRLGRAGLAIGDLDAVLVTHEHADHMAGVASLARRWQLPVYATLGTAQGARWLDRAEVATRLVTVVSGEYFSLGPLRCLAFAVPHDAAEPCHFVFDDGDSRLGIVSDLGWPDPAVAAALNGLDALMLEANHDLQRLRQGPYPRLLKERIESRHGHLSNEQAAELLAALDRGRLRVLVATHLSQANNLPELAREALAAVFPAPILVATQEGGLDWVTVPAGGGTTLPPRLATVDAGPCGGDA